MRNPTSYCQQQGVSLIELMLVLLVAGVIIVGGMYTYDRYQRHEKFLQVRQSVTELMKAMNTYYFKTCHIKRAENTYLSVYPYKDLTDAGFLTNPNRIQNAFGGSKFVAGYHGYTVPLPDNAPAPTAANPNVNLLFRLIVTAYYPGDLTSHKSDFKAESAVVVWRNPAGLKGCDAGSKHGSAKCKGFTFVIWSMLPSRAMDGFRLGLQTMSAQLENFAKQQDNQRTLCPM